MVHVIPVFIAEGFQHRPFLDTDPVAETGQGYCHRQDRSEPGPYCQPKPAK
jgi:hypothetical protein